MGILQAIVGVVCVIGAVILGLAELGLPPTALGGLSGFGAGLIVAAATRFLWDRFVQPTPGGGVTDSVYESQGSTCETCRRALPPGVAKCPFCHPVIPQESPLGATHYTDHQPLQELVPMAGLAAAAKQMKEVGARGYLHIFTGANKGQSVLLGATPVSIGRAPENTLILMDDGVSHHHVAIMPRGDQFFAKDVGSKNGTFINDQRIDEGRLTSGDVLGVGTTKMLFQVHGQR